MRTIRALGSTVLAGRPLPPRAAGERVWETTIENPFPLFDPCRPRGQVKQFGQLPPRPLPGLRPLPPRAAGEAVWELTRRLPPLPRPLPARPAGEGVWEADSRFLLALVQPCKLLHLPHEAAGVDRGE